MPFASPAAELATERTPTGASVIPVGSGEPLGDTPNVPPFLTPLGSVDLRSKDVTAPAEKKGKMTFHAAGAAVDGAGAGEGAEPEPAEGEGVGAGLADGGGTGVGSPSAPDARGPADM